MMEPVKTTPPASAIADPTEIDIRAIHVSVWGFLVTAACGAV
jgi:hypothetical protein